MAILQVEVASGEVFAVHRFTVQEAISDLFAVTLVAASQNPTVDLEAIIGQPASFRVVSGWLFAKNGGARLWTGIVRSIEQVQAVQSHAFAREQSTYHLTIVPTLWILTNRRNYRIFQHLSIPDIVDRVLDDWRLPRAWNLDRAIYPKLEYKVQYGENDYAFICRLLEETGISFTFPDDDSDGSKLTLADKLETNPPRPGGALPFVDNPNQAAEIEFVSKVGLSHEVRPGAFTVRDYDFRNPAFALFGEAQKATAPEDRYEQYHYQPGAFLIETGKGGGTPIADDKGVARYDQSFGHTRSQRMLHGERLARRNITFETNTIDLWPGQVFSMDGHPHAEITNDTGLLVTAFSIQGARDGDWSMSGRAVFTAVPYLPTVRTAKPHVEGVQSATVVGPKGQEIHTDEFGRVRVQFPWDREGKSDENSSCWVRVSQGWAGTGYGMIVIPRIGQEVLVGFLGGDPEQPIVVGRVFNATQAVPYKLPEHKTRSTWKSDSSMGSNGFNEIMFEDLKGKELVYVQAEKNLRKLVKNDETITVGRNRQKYVVQNETETTGANRIEVTGANRTEITAVNRTTVIGGNNSKLVKGDEIERTEGNMMLFVGQDQDIVVKQVRRERVGKDSHLRVKGNRNQKIDKTQSLTVGKNQYERVGKNHALEVGKEIHLKAGSALIIEAAKDLTIKGPGGFIRIDAGGVTIQGKMVRINSGGTAGSGSGSHPIEPDDAIDAEVVEPEKPVPDNVFKTGLAQ